MQIGVSPIADPEITSMLKTYKLFWYQKDIAKWNIMCDSSWKYIDRNTIRVWALVPDTIFNAPGFDPQDCTNMISDPCRNFGYCCGSLDSVRTPALTRTHPAAPRPSTRCARPTTCSDEAGSDAQTRGTRIWSGTSSQSFPCPVGHLL